METKTEATVVWRRRWYGHDPRALMATCWHAWRDGATRALCGTTPARTMLSRVSSKRWVEESEAHEDPSYGTRCARCCRALGLAPTPIMLPDSEVESVTAELSGGLWDGRRVKLRIIRRGHSTFLVLPSVGELRPVMASAVETG